MDLWNKYPEIASELQLVEKTIRENVHSKNKLLNSITEELVASGGKRLRPAFVILSAKFGEYDGSKVVKLAGAIEILHTATLVHDDVIDRSKLRRGKMTVSEKYGIDMAIYTGDFLFTKAIMLLSGNVPLDNLDTLARGIKTICEGEVSQFQDKFNLDVSILSYLKRISRKTAVMFGAACALGADISKCSEDIKKSLVKFGLYYGIAFQIKDDLNNIISDVGTSGKPVSSDFMEGVITLPVIYALKNNKEARDVMEKLVGKRNKMTLDDVKTVTDIVKESGGIDNSFKLLKKYVERGINALEAIPDNQYKDIFYDLIVSLQ
ncbi:MAG TPA: polyprenyl synthetase family protein [Clostridiaceae bacterium]|nr:polyprenyl synthetase family protein [Clostridiaceae bacterium]